MCPATSNSQTSALRVAIVNLAKRRGGAETRTLQLMTGLQHAGVIPHLVCLAGSPLASEAQTRDLQTVCLEGSRLSWQNVRQLAAILRSEKFAAVDSHNTQSHAITALANLTARAAQVLTIHSTYSKSERTFFGMSLHEVVLKLVSRPAKAMISVSSSVTDGLPAAVRTKLSATIYSGVATQAEPAPSPDEIRSRHGLDARKIVALVGRLVPAKDLHLALDVAHLLATEFDTKAHFVFVGDGSLRTELESYADERGLLDAANRVTVTFVGHREDVSHYYAAADMLLMTSITEGLPFTALEAAHCGVPMVSTDVGSVREVFEPAGSALVEREPDRKVMAGKLASKVAQLLGDDTALHVLGEQARTHVSAHYTVASMCDQTAAVYRAAAARQGLIP